MRKIKQGGRRETAKIDRMRGRGQMQERDKRVNPRIKEGQNIGGGENLEIVRKGQSDAEVKR